MPNPYHDDQGRFCSKGEMISTIAKLLEKGDLAGARKMQQELTQYELASTKTADPQRVSDFKNRILITQDIQPVLAVLASQTVSEADVKQAEKELNKELAEANLEVAKIDVAQAELNHELQKEYGDEEITFNSLFAKMITAEQENQTAKTDITDFIRREAIKEGIPARYIASYMERKAPELGFEDYVNAYQGVRVASVNPYNVASDSKVWASNTRPAEYKAIIQKIAEKAEKEGLFAKYNNTYPPANNLRSLWDRYNTQALALTRQAKVAEERTQKIGSALKTIRTIKTWETAKKQVGLSKYAKVTSVGDLSPQELKKDANGQITNLTVFNEKGEGERILQVKPSSFSPTSGVLLGESGKEYSSVLHWANRGKSYRHNDYIILEPTAKGEPYFNDTSKIRSFHIEYDSGD